MENYILRTENNELYNKEEKHVGYTFNLIEDIIENNKITSHTIIEYITDLQGLLLKTINYKSIRKGE
jgi:cytochrome oxidase Cu insertion factor (SCO1/SenC/PrrC family)